MLTAQALRHQRLRLQHVMALVPAEWPRAIAGSSQLVGDLLDLFT